MWHHAVWWLVTAILEEPAAGAHAKGVVNQNWSNTDFVDTMLLQIFYDLPFSQNQLLKLADDYCIRILKNKMKSLGIITWT